MSRTYRRAYDGRTRNSAGKRFTDGSAAVSDWHKKAMKAVHKTERLAKNAIIADAIEDHYAATA